jgi:hypothetical protein
MMQDVERVARAICADDPDIRMGDAEGVVQQRVNVEWKNYTRQATAAISAMTPDATNSSIGSRGTNAGSAKAGVGGACGVGPAGRFSGGAGGSAASGRLNHGAAGAGGTGGSSAAIFYQDDITPSFGATSGTVDYERGWNAAIEAAVRACEGERWNPATVAQSDRDGDNGPTWFNDACNTASRSIRQLKKPTGNLAHTTTDSV